MQHHIQKSLSTHPCTAPLYLESEGQPLYLLFLLSVKISWLEIDFSIAQVCLHFSYSFT